MPGFLSVVGCISIAAPAIPRGPGPLGIRSLGRVASLHCPLITYYVEDEGDRLNDVGGQKIALIPDNDHDVHPLADLGLQPEDLHQGGE